MRQGGSQWQVSSHNSFESSSPSKGEIDRNFSQTAPTIFGSTANTSREFAGRDHPPLPLDYPKNGLLRAFVKLWHGYAIPSSRRRSRGFRKNRSQESCHSTHEFFRHLLMHHDLQPGQPMPLSGTVLPRYSTRRLPL